MLTIRRGHWQVGRELERKAAILDPIRLDSQHLHNLGRLCHDFSMTAGNLHEFPRHPKSHGQELEQGDRRGLLVWISRVKSESSAPSCSCSSAGSWSLPFLSSLFEEILKKEFKINTKKIIEKDCTSDSSERGSIPFSTSIISKLSSFAPCGFVNSDDDVTGIRGSRRGARVALDAVADCCAPDLCVLPDAGDSDCTATRAVGGQCCGCGTVPSLNFLCR